MDFTLDLGMTKEHNNETVFTLWCPPRPLPQLSDI